MDPTEGTWLRHHASCRGAEHNTIKAIKNRLGLYSSTTLCRCKWTLFTPCVSGVKVHLRKTWPHLKAAGPVSVEQYRSFSP